MRRLWLLPPLLSLLLRWIWVRRLCCSSGRVNGKCSGREWQRSIDSRCSSESRRERGSQWMGWRPEGGQSRAMGNLTRWQTVTTASELSSTPSSRMTGRGSRASLAAPVTQPPLNAGANRVSVHRAAQPRPRRPRLSPLTLRSLSSPLSSVLCVCAWLLCDCHLPLLRCLPAPRSSDVEQLRFPIVLGSH